MSGCFCFEGGGGDFFLVWLKVLKFFIFSLTRWPLGNLALFFLGFLSKSNVFVCFTLIFMLLLVHVSLVSLGLMLFAPFQSRSFGLFG